MSTSQNDTSVLRRGKYRRYARDPTVKVPRNTLRRYRQKSAVDWFKRLAASSSKLQFAHCDQIFKTDQYVSREINRILCKFARPKGSK